MKTKERMQRELAVERLLIEEKEVRLRYFDDGRRWAMAVSYVELRLVVVSATRFMAEEVEFSTKGFPRSIVSRVGGPGVPIGLANEWMEAWCEGVLSFWDEFAKKALRSQDVV